MDIEKQAEAQHAIWAHWMKYMFSQCENVGGVGNAVLIPGDLVDRWTRQSETPYSELTETKKESDRNIVRDFILKQ